MKDATYVRRRFVQRSVSLYCSFMLLFFASLKVAISEPKEREGSFEKKKDAQARIRSNEVRFDLLEEGVIEFTNRWRLQKGHEALTYSSKAREAARLQAQAMAKKGEVTHENPETPTIATLEKRLAQAKLSPRAAAENVASFFLLQLGKGGQFFIREEKGKRVVTKSITGPPVERHSYTSFSKDIVDFWMGSPHHRENILSDRYTHIGVSCELRRDPSTADLFFCAQVFFTP